jgi:copper(I)-binding protein
MRLTRTFSVLATGAAALVLVGCGSGDSGGAAPSVPPSPSVVGPSAAALMMKDPWVKTAASGMSAAFGTMMNTTDQEIVIVSATSTASPTMELHETAMVDGKMAMRPKQGGFTIAPKGSHELKPGGDHLMMMDVVTPVKPGDEVTVTLTLKDGSTVKFSAVGKDYAGGNESYLPSPGASGMSMG